MYLKGRSVPLRKRRTGSNPRRMILWLVLLVGALLILPNAIEGRIRSPLEPTPTATRNPVSWAEEAKAQFAAGRLEEAVEAYGRAIEADPQNPQNYTFWVEKARVQIFQEKFAEALESAENAVLLAPDNARTRAIQAWALRENDRLDEAQAAAVQAIALDSNYAPAHAYYSLILNDKQIVEQGFREAEAALDLDSTLLEGHIAMGYANEAQGAYGGAIERYKDALRINPNIVSIYLRIGLNYRAAGPQQDFEQAIYYLGKANSVDPFNVQPLLALARTHIQIDQLGTAQQYLDAALNLEPGNPDIHGRLGALYFKRKNYEGAEPELRLAVLGGSYTTEDGLTVQVEPMPLDNARALEYYYTLGNLRAYNATAANPESCGPDPDDAPALLNKALRYEPDNLTVQGSYEESMAICGNALAGIATPLGPDATPVGAMTPTPP